jgi:hypothetical protein
LDVGELREAGIKAAVHRELVGSDYAEVNGRVREYVQGIANVHGEFRRATEVERQRWAAVYRNTYERGNATWADGEMRASDLIAYDDSGTVLESRHVFLAPLEYLVSLESKNAGPWALARSYVSNVSEAKDA